MAKTKQKAEEDFQDFDADEEMDQDLKADDADHDLNLKPSESKQPQKISILDYDYKNPKPIDSPRSLRAMEQVFVTKEQLVQKKSSAFRDVSVNKADLEKLLLKDEREVKCYIKQVIDKRKEIIKQDNRKQKFEQKEKLERQTKTKKLKVQAEEAEKLKKELEKKAAEEIEKKFEDRILKAQQENDSISPFYDQYNNLTYVPKPKEYFKLSAQNKTISQQLELSKSKAALLKQKQLREMNHMMDYEINLQQIKKRNEVMQKKKQEMLKSIESLKKQKFERNMGILEEIDLKMGLQKKMDKETKLENKERLMKMKKRDEMIKFQKIKEHEDRAKMLKEYESNFEQNRKYLIKQLLIDFSELKVGALSAEEVKSRYSYLKDEASFEKAMMELNRRRQLSRLRLNRRDERRQRPRLRR